jgi:HEAT repeat protein
MRPLFVACARFGRIDRSAHRCVGPEQRDAVDPLCVALVDSNGGIRLRSAEALGKIGPDAKPSVPALIRALADNEEIVRSNAGAALKKIDPVEAARAGVP